MSDIIEKLGITPGPWEKSEKVCDVVISKSVKELDDEAKRRGHTDIDYYGGFCVAESIFEKNRGVIAAAPEMLEALIKLSVDPPLDSSVIVEIIEPIIEKSVGMSIYEIKELL